MGVIAQALDGKKDLDLQTYVTVSFSFLSSKSEARLQRPISATLLLLFFLALYCPMTCRFSFGCLGKSGGGIPGSA